MRVNGQALCKAVCTATLQVKEVSKWNTTVTTKTNREDGDIYSQDRRTLDGQTYVFNCIERLEMIPSICYDVVAIGAVLAKLRCGFIASD